MSCKINSGRQDKRMPFFCHSILHIFDGGRGSKRGLTANRLLTRNTYIHISIHFQIKKKCTELQLVCIHLVLFVTPCKTLDSVKCTCVSLSIVRDADTLRGVAVARGSWWSPHSCIALATWRATNASGARRTRGSCSGLSWWPCRRDTEGEHS